MKMMKTKHLRRLAVFLAMIAPAVYLFGTSFSALTGAHGERILEDTSYITPSYDDLMTAENFSYGAFDWTNEHGTRLGFSLGYLELSDYYDGFNLNANSFGISCYPNNSDTYDHGLGFSGEQEIDLSINYYLDINSLEIEVAEALSSVDMYTAGYVESGGAITAFIIISSNQNNEILYFYYTGEDWDEALDLDVGDSYAFIYFDDGAHLPEGIEWNDELRSYFVPTVKPVEVVSYPVTLFGSFFPADNFLVQWGENAISDNPAGFAPFGAFWRYLDTNVLHLSNDQVGLMGYGYMYYASHVLLFDIGFIIVTFFLDFIQRIFEKFTGGE